VTPASILNLLRALFRIVAMTELQITRRVAACLPGVYPMRSASIFWIMVTFAVLVIGCRKHAGTQGRGDSHEPLVKEAIATMGTAADNLDRVKDPASAEEAVNVLNREADRLDSLRERLTRLGKASRTEQDRFNKQDSQSMITASRRMKESASALIGKLKAGKFTTNLADRLRGASDRYAKAMTDFAGAVGPLYQ
jgi:hypothetical protein